MKTGVFAALFFSFLIQNLYARVCNDIITLNAPYTPTPVTAHVDSLTTQNCDGGVAQMEISFSGKSAGETVSLPSSMNIATTDGLILLVTFSPANLILTNSGGSTIISLDVDSGSIGNVGFQSNGGAPEGLLTNSNRTRYLIISQCRFELISAANTGIQLYGSNILIDRCYFRSQVSPLAGERPTGISLTSQASNVEIRSSLFITSGVTIQTPSFNLVANTFVGKTASNRNEVEYNGNNLNSFKILHNLFAMEDTNAVSIKFNGTVSATSQISYNAYAGIALHQDVIALQETANAKLPRGLSNYTEGDYPLVQMASDPTLDPSHADFGKVPDVYKNIPPVIPNIGDLPPSNLLFTGGSTPFFPYNGIQWGAGAGGIKAGCFFTALSALPPIAPPSPLTSLQFILSGINISRSAMAFDTAYYGELSAADTIRFYMGLASDTVSLKSDAPGGSPTIFGGVSNYKTVSDQNIPVPWELRTGVPIYLRAILINTRSGRSLANYTPASLVRISGIPRYPDLDASIATFSVKEGIQEIPQNEDGTVNLSMTLGTEDIDSVRVNAIWETGGNVVYATQTQTAALASGGFRFEGLPAVSFHFEAYPIGKGGATTASPKVTNSVTVKVANNSIIYVKPLTGCSFNEDGSGRSDDPYCSVQTALERMNASSAEYPSYTLVVMWDKDIPRMDTLINPLSTSTANIARLNLVSQAYINASEILNDRPVIRDLVINRPNTIIKGFKIDRSSEIKPAVLISSPGAVIDGNVINSDKLKNLMEINGTSAADSVTITNNLLIGGEIQLNFQSAANALIANNNFIDTSGNTVGLYVENDVAGAGIVMANNYFTGLNGRPYGIHNSNFGVTDDIMLWERNVFGHRDPDTNIFFQRVQPTLNFNPCIVRGVTDPFFTFEQFIELGCGTDSSNTLYAGSAPQASLGFAVSTDIRGRSRDNKPEVGAFEYKRSADDFSHPKSFDSLNVTSSNSQYLFTSLNYEPGLSPYLHVWWQLYTDRSQPYTSAIGMNSHAVADFDSGDLNGISILGSTHSLQPVKAYSMCASFGDATTPDTSRKFCRVFTTPSDTTSTGCDAASLTRCPTNPGEFFGGPHSQFPAGIQVYYEFSKISDVKTSAITIGEIAADAVPGLAVNHLLPYFEFSVEALAASDPAQSADNYLKVVADLSQTINTSGLQMYRQDMLEGGTLYFHPAWRLNGNILTIESKKGGKFFFASGPSGAVGKVEPAAPSVYFTPEMGAVDLVFSGTGFITSNPAVMVAAYPAGALMDDAIFGQNKAAKPILYSRELNGLSPALAARWGYQFYKSMSQQAPAPVSKPEFFGSVPVSLPLDSAMFAATFPTAGILPDIAAGQFSTTVSYPIPAGYIENNSRAKISRGIELLFMVFDGGRVSYARTILRSQIGTLLSPKNPDQIVNGDVAVLTTRSWHLISYPYTISDSDQGSPFYLTGLESQSSWNGFRQKIEQYKNGSYVEYNPDNPATFPPMDSGKAAWVLTWDTKNIQDEFKPFLTGGLTNDSGAFSIQMTAGDWNDFGLPFNFPIKWGDIKTASPGLNGSAFAFNAGYKTWDWSQGGEGEPTDGRFILNGEAWTALEDTTTLYPWRGYTILPSANFSMNFPVIDFQRSEVPPLPKLSAGQYGHRVKVLAGNASALTSVTIGLAERPFTIGRMPMVPGQDFALDLEDSDQGQPLRLSSSILPSGESLNSSWPLSARFAHSTGSITLRLGTVENLPDTAGIYLIDVLHQTVQPLTRPVTLTKKQADEGLYSLVMGSEQFARDLSGNGFIRFANSPNPFKSRTLFTFSQPAQLTRLSAEYRLEIFDLAGKRVNTYDRKAAPGAGISFEWDGTDSMNRPLPSGYYLARFTLTIPHVRTFTAMRKCVKLD